MRIIEVTERGAARWVRGHSWIYRSDLKREEGGAGVVAVHGPRGQLLGTAVYSPESEIRLRLLDRGEGSVDLMWWHGQLAAALARRDGIDATAYRLVHGEGDGLPGLVVDRYGEFLVVQILSAGLATVQSTVLDAIRHIFDPKGILLRNDARVRRREGLELHVDEAWGTVPQEIEVREGPIRYLVDPWRGQKTGAFLDQRINRLRAAHYAKPGGRALDCFAYHGSFALHLAQVAGEVTAVDSSSEALSRGQGNAALNQLDNISWIEGDVFTELKALEHRNSRFDTIVVDPPAFAKHRGAISDAVRGYRQVNLRAMRLLTRGGILITASCSYHVRREAFLDLLREAAADSGRRVTVLEHLGQSPDHPESLTVPETGYLKGVILRVE